MRKCSTSRLLSVSAIGLVLSACADTPPPSLVQARGDLNTAATAPADSYSKAEFNEAQQKLAQAEGAARQDEMASADRLSQEAMADLRLAHARADAEKARAAANDMQSAIGTLQDEVNHSAVPRSSTLLPSP